jgi:outer membrane receptor for ferrienterochelin and colicins
VPRAALCRRLLPWLIVLATLQARSDDRDAAAPPQKLEKIEVRGPDDVDERRQSTAAKIVVSHDELTRYGDTTLLDAVKRLPGITVESDGRGGGSIKMRGLGNGYTQILLDGEPTPAGFSIESLSPDLIERIEIYRGATAELSTQAIAGTLNIVLRKAVSQRRRQVKLGTSVTNGQVSTTTTAELSDRDGRLSYVLPASLNTSRFRNQSMAEQVGRDAASIPDLDYVTESPVRGHGLAIGLAPRLNWDLGKEDALGWQSFLNYNRFRGEFDERTTLLFGEPPAFPSNNLAFAATNTSLRNDVDWKRSLGNEARIEAKLAVNYNHRSSSAVFDAFDPAGTYVLHRTVDGRVTDDGVTLKGKYTFPLVAGHSLVAGVDGEHARRTEDRLQVDATPAGATTFEIDESYDARVARLALYAQDDWDVTPRLALYLGLRWEGIDTRSTGNTFAEVHNRSGVWSPIVQALWKLPGTEKDQLRAGLARTYKAPSTFDLMPRRYIANNNTATTPDFQGNPTLGPELSWGLDLAYEHYFGGGGVFSASAYERRIDDVILHELLDVNGTFILRPANEGRATVKGIEIDAKAGLASFFPSAPAVEVHANLSRHWSSVDFLPGPDNRLAQQPRWTGNLGVDWQVASHPLTLGANFRLVTAGPVRLSSTQAVYTSVSRNLDVYGQWKFPKGAGELRIYANNLLRQDRLAIETFADPARSLELSTITPSFPTIGINYEAKF